MQAAMPQLLPPAAAYGTLVAALNILKGIMAASPVGSADAGVNTHPTKALQGVGQPVQTFVQALAPAKRLRSLNFTVEECHPVTSSSSLHSQVTDARGCCSL